MDREKEKEEEKRQVKEAADTAGRLEIQKEAKEAIEKAERLERQKLEQAKEKEIADMAERENIGTRGT